MELLTARGWPSLALAAGLIVSGCAKKTQEGPVQGPPRVTVALPETRELVDVEEYNGWLDASETVEVRSRVRGHIAEIKFTDGEFVEENAPLFVLDERPFQAELNRAAAQLQVFEAQKVAADRELVRLRELLTKGGASQSQVDKAEADVGSLAAQIESAKQDVERNRLDLEFATIKAPIAGKIGRALLTAGNLVNAGGSDPVLTTIVSFDPIFVYFHVDERALQNYLRKRKTEDPDVRDTPLQEKGMQCFFGLEIDEGFPHEARVEFANNKVDRTTGTIQLRAETPNPEMAFVPGSRVRVQVPVSKPYEALLVADTAVLTDQDRKYLLVVGPDGLVLRRDVTLGRLERDGMRVVEKGIEATDRVIVLGLQRARVNYPVAAFDADGKPISSEPAEQPRPSPGESEEKQD